MLPAQSSCLLMLDLFHSYELLGALLQRADFHGTLSLCVWQSQNNDERAYFDNHARKNEKSTNYWCEEKGFR